MKPGKERPREVRGDTGRCRIPTKRAAKQKKKDTKNKNKKWTQKAFKKQFFSKAKQGKGRPREVEGDTMRCRKTTKGAAKQKKKDQKKTKKKKEKKRPPKKTILFSRG